MPIRLTCACGKVFSVGEKYAGRRGKCPACGTVLTIPEKEAFAAASVGGAVRYVCDDCGYSRMDKPDADITELRCRNCSGQLWPAAGASAQPEVIGAPPPDSGPPPSVVPDFVYERTPARRSLTVPAHDLTDDDLKVAVVELLVARLYHSCIEPRLPKYVLKHLGLQLRGPARQQFSARLSRVVGHLKAAKIVEGYKTKKHARLRLTRHAQDLYPSPRPQIEKRRPQTDGPHGGSAPTGQLGESIRHVEPDSELTMDDLDLLENEIPDLPDIKSDTDTDPGDGARVQDGPPPAEHEWTDDESGRLLGILTGSPESSEQPAPHGKPDLLGGVEHILSQEPNLIVERQFQELRMLLECPETIVEMLASFDPMRGEVHVRALLPFREQAASDLLRLSGQDGFVATVGLTEEQGERYYVVRKLIQTRGRPVEEVAGTMQRVLAEAAKAAALLDGAA